MLLFSAIWIFFVFRFILMRLFMTEWSYRVCYLNGCEASYLFAYKCLFWSYPAYLIISTMAFLIIVFGYLVYLFEPITLVEATWMIVVSIFTIGYGDLNPKDPIAWFLLILALVLGLYVTALLVLNFWMLFSRRE